MNKISKKILAIVTMAAFVVTMMPFAAFAANAVADTSYYGTVDENVTAETFEDVVTVFDICDNSGASIDNGSLNPVMVWAEEDGEISSAATFFTVNENDEADQPLKAADSQVYSYVTEDKTVTTDLKLAVQFARPGEYTLHAALVQGEKVTEFATDDAHNTVVVSAGDVNQITVANVDDPIADNGKAEIGSVFANGTQTGKVTVTAWTGEDSDVVAAGKDFTISAKSGLTLSTDTATTDRKGEFEFSYTANRAGTYYITLTSEDGFKAQLIVEAYDRSTSYPADITTTVDNGATMNVDDVTTGTTLEDAVQFEIEDQNGKVLTANEGLANQPAAIAKAEAEDTDKTDYVKLTAPTKFKGSAEDFTLVWNKDENAYTLKYEGTATLVAGEYTVRVSLYDTGDFADATFTLGEFDEDAVVDMKIVPSAERVAYTDGDFTYKVILVDENGVEKNVTGVADEYYMGIDSSATLGAKFDTVDNTSGVTFNVVPETEKEDVVGSVITLTAVSDKYGFMKTAEITVTDESVVAGLAFDKNNGAAGEDNTVKVSVVDENGDVIKDVTNGTIKVYVADQSNENANVEVTAGDNVINGENGTITVFADEETTLDIVVAVLYQNRLYADTLEYTVGAEDITANTTVAMTIGSSDIIVNNDIVSGDAAPFVDSNWRTMVPVRALSEAFGGTAEWDGDARTVTVENGDTTIVFTADSDKYTVNGEEKTMDTALTIVGGRTYVPVRFVADELGYQITVLKDAQGLTAGVVFQK